LSITQFFPATESANGGPIGWQKELDVGTARAKLTIGLPDCLPVRGQKYIQVEIMILTRLQTYRETIRLVKTISTRYDATLNFYTTDIKPAYIHHMALEIVNIRTPKAIAPSKVTADPPFLSAIRYQAEIRPDAPAILHIQLVNSGKATKRVISKYFWQFRPDLDSDIAKRASIEDEVWDALLKSLSFPLKRSEALSMPPGPALLIDITGPVISGAEIRSLNDSEIVLYFAVIYFDADGKKILESCVHTIKTGSDVKFCVSHN
jgi:hypothetical protein